MQITKHYNEITWLKVIAATFIIWFHLKWYVPQEFAPLFIGGAIGNSLFFFCSGYLLKFKSERYLGQWILKKYIRLMPAVWITYILCSATYSFTDCYWVPINLGTWLLPKYYWFICSLLLYYTICWICKQFLTNKNCQINIILIIFITCFVQLIWYLLFCETTNVNIDGGNIKAWYFFVFFLWGYYCKQRQIKYQIPKWTIFTAPFSLALFFGYKIVAVNNIYLTYCQVFIIPLILSFAIFSFCGIAQILTSITIPSLIKKYVSFVSNITLEIYVVQVHIAEYVMPHILFPYNIVVTVLLIFLIAYIVNRLINLISSWSERI